jgi:hypothetical protein
MKLTYEVIKDELGNESIYRSDGWIIPVDPANSDYQEYLNPSEAETI